MKALCNKALVSCDNQIHNKRDVTKKASNMMGSQINIFLSSVTSEIFGTKSRDEITTAVNVLDDYKEYQVYASFKKGIKAAVVFTTKELIAQQ